MSRSRILTTIRQSLAAARHLPKAPPISLAPQLPITNHQLLIDTFAIELRSLSGIFLSTSRAEAPALVARLVHERQATSLLAWEQAQLPVPGLLDYLRAEAGVMLVDANLPHAEPARSARLAEVEQVTIGLTGADAVLADTGTLALRAGPGRPRLASLSVRTHIVLFTPNQVYASWAAWWASLPNQAEWVREASNLTLISGPSRTADIEMTLTVGVHGPRELIAIVCE